ncbi:AAA family ATPase [Ruania zhangjianzhongii]|uniref:AAA family ATPase n=1 Tax=Ruania zhangjianzhongii TaxID=2603206 RepID=UPI00143DA585|nr:AAA family ATPase [Ruania zhangjianzhongii]
MPAADDGADAVVRIGILGQLSVAVDGEDVTPRGPTQRRLIAALAVAARREARLPIAELVDTVYAGELPPRPRRSLATLVWRLRKKWGARVIDSDPYGYWLVTARCRIDAADFEALLLRGSALDRAGDRPAATAAFGQALSMWRGTEEPPPHLPATEANRLTELRLGAMERLAELLAADARTSEAIELLEPVAAARPEWEHSQALLIGCHLELGNPADAHRVCDRARRALIDQGIEPGPELSRAIERLGDAAASAPSPARPGGQVASPGHSSGPRHPAVAVRAAEATPTDDRAALVGRTADLEAVADTAATAIRTGRPAAVVISGEAGIGKSVLVRAALTRLAAEGAPRALILPCDPRRTLPYALFAPLVPDEDSASPLARLLGGDASAEPAVSTDVLHEELSRRLRAIASPAGLVLVVEDLHWAPPGTAEALAALLDRAGPLPMAVVLTTRRRTAGRQLAPWITRRIRLTGLDHEAVAELIGAGGDPDRAAAMQRLTGGNPLYLHQLHQAGTVITADRPDDLRAAIDAHLQIVSEEVLVTLRIAAAVGDSFTIMTLAALAGELRQDLPTWRDHLTVAASHGLIREAAGAGSHEFVHTLIREHLYQQLAAEEQTRTHAGIGRALSRLALSRPCPADLLAHHYMRGWPHTSTREVVDHLTAAGRAAAAQLDFTQAAAHYRAGLDYLAMDPEHSPDEDTAQLLGAAAGACAAAGQTQSANELYQSQLQLARTAGMPRWQLFAALGNLRTHYARRVGPEVTDPLVAAVAQASSTGVIANLPELAGDALAAIQVYRPGRAAELLAAATEVEPALTGRLRTAVWEHQTVPDQLATARQLVQDPTADPVGSWLRLWVSEVAAGVRAMDDQPACPVPITEADDQTRFDLTQWRITTTIATGQIERGHRLIDEALAAPPHLDPAENARRAASFYGQRTYLAMVSGDVEAARRSPLLSNPSWASRHPIMRYVSAYLRSGSAPLEETRDRCADLLEEVRDQDIPDSDIVPRLLLLGRVCIRSGEQSAINQCVTHLLPHRGEHGLFRFGQYWGSADGVLAWCYEKLGDLDRAVELFESAIAGHEAVHAFLDLQMMRDSLARTLESRGRSGDIRWAEQLRHSA